MGYRETVVAPLGARDFLQINPVAKWVLAVSTVIRQLRLRLRMSVGIPSLPHVPSWRVQGPIYVSICLLFYRHKDALFIDKKLSKNKIRCLFHCYLKTFSVVKIIWCQ